MEIVERMLRSIKRRKGNIILRAEFSKFGSPSQVSKALKTLQGAGKIVRIGNGIYAKTRKSSVTGATVPSGSLETLVSEALKKLGVEIRAGRATASYNDGRTTQLPGSFVVNTGNRRISRRITVGGRAVKFENNYGRTEPTD